MNFITTRKTWYSLSIAAVVACIIALAAWGLRLNIEFTGGALAEYSTQAGVESVKAAADSAKVTASVVQSDRGAILRSASISEEQRTAMLAELKKQDATAEELRFEAVGPSLSSELRGKSVTAVLAALLMILLYVAWAFRRVAGRIQAWKYGALVVMSGLFATLIPLGVFAILGRFHGTEIGATFVAAILTILGYSINDTIVVFDRVRENILRTDGTVAEIVDRSINQTVSRSIKTGFATLMVLGIIYTIGGDSTKDFALALFIGIAAGTYSSLFLASPLLVDWQRKRG